MLTEIFSQDYFGRQRSIGVKMDNPAIRDFGYKDNSIRNQKVARPIPGNIGGIDETNFFVYQRINCISKKAKKITKMIFCSTCLIL